MGTPNLWNPKASFSILATNNQYVRRSLLAWFERSARSLPWRESRDAYRIWISEVMLQQTQVATVIPYFHKFLECYPTLANLADADEHDVLQLWEGLGYYRRARDLLKAARQLRDAGFATVPNDASIVRSLPGFGRYTTNAVLSQAYDARLPILEANSTRLLCRLFGIEGDPKRADNQSRLWHLAEVILPRKNVGAFNQALMELGSLVCKPNTPACPSCPLKRSCVAFRHGRQAEIPHRAQAAEITNVAETAVVISRGDRILLVQRPSSGRWANLWEFPHVENASGETNTQTAARLLSTLGVSGMVDSEIATIRHSVTRYRITLTAFHATYQSGLIESPMHPNHAWVRLNELSSYPLSAPQRRLARALMTTVHPS